ncbi:MAG TPA: 3-phosphoserine/phosphohydroxythreonine aminotransferase [Clostridiales bacterium]|nr:3-phosphoserine/phosphohydroxythreonine aminotransferase [Clostridiales bacterium]
MTRFYNYSAGPSMLPLEILKKAASELVCYGSSGMSVMEMSHRSTAFEEIIHQAEASLRKLMEIPNEYAVLFLQGGATTQFSMIPMNLMTKNGKADYIVSGYFAEKAYKEATKFGSARVVATSEDKKHTEVPYVEKNAFDPEADYVHICYNNTIFGTTFDYIPDTGDIPLVADMSSYIMSEPVDVSRFGLIYAGAQKNIGPAGVTIVVVKKDLIGNAPAHVPSMLNYQMHLDHGSMYNTPPCYAIYMAGLVFDWLLANGGLAAIKIQNEKKAKLLYSYLDRSNLFKNSVLPNNRSRMNVTFVTGSPEMDKKFCKEAEDAGLLNLKGHRLVGGMRASIYNAHPLDGVEALISFMEKFEKANG